MRKFLLAIACAVCAFSVSAQRASTSSTSFFSTEKADQGIIFGIRAGMNIANIKASGDGYSASPDSKVGFNVGVNVDFPLLESFYLQSGLYYTTKGYKSDFGDGEEETANPSYLQIPIMASYRYNFSEATQLQINFGPYFAYGVNGKSKYTYDGEEEKSDFFGDDIKKFDAGLGVGAGFTFNKFFVGLNYEFGLTNMVKHAEDDYSVKNKNLSISVGYNF